MFGGKKSTKKDEEPTQSMETAVQPIPRHLPSQSVTLNFTMRTWEEVAPGKLYYLPICQNPLYIMDKCMLNQFYQFSSLWATMEIHKPQVKLSNFIMLQDDLRVQNNTPTDATAFTQVVYMLHYQPKNQQMYFALQNLGDDDLYLGANLVYDLQPKRPNVSRMVEIDNFDNFERLLIKTADPGTTAGFCPGTSLTIRDSGQLVEKYISPDFRSDPDKLCRVAANLQPYIAEDDTDTTFIKNGSQLLFSRNQDKIEFVKYGDTIEFDIVTNLENKRILSNKMNDFTETVQVTLKDKAGTCREYLTEWCYPGPNRPYYSRSTNLEGQAFPMLLNKKLKPLQHHFFCMPPIKKPNGALLGQRCSFLLEQHFSVTFNFSTAIWPSLDEEDIDISEERYLLEQKEAINLRRNIYGVPGSLDPPKSSPFCGFNKIPTDCGQACPVNDWSGLIHFFVTQVTGSDWEQMYTISPNPNEIPDNQVFRISAEYFRTEYWTADNSTQNAWLQMLEDPTKYMVVEVTEAQSRTIDGVDYLLFGEVGNDVNTNYFWLVYKDGMPKHQYIYINATQFIKIRNNFMDCTNPGPSKAVWNSETKGPCWCQAERDACEKMPSKKRKRIEAEKEYAGERFDRRTIMFYS